MLLHIYTGDEDEIKNELIGLVYEKLTAVLKATNNTLETKWYNLYGKPEDKNENLVSSPLSLYFVIIYTTFLCLLVCDIHIPHLYTYVQVGNVVKGVKTIKEKAGDLVEHKINYELIYNNVPG